MKHKPKKKATKKAKRGMKMASIEINLSAEQRGYVAELAEYACTNIETVCAVMMACGIFKARRFELPFNEELKASRARVDELNDRVIQLDAKLARCREVMEANDPINALDIFGVRPTPEGSHVDPRGPEERPSDV